METLRKGNLYDSWDAFQESFLRYCTDTNQVFVKSDSKTIECYNKRIDPQNQFSTEWKYHYVRYSCVRGQKPSMRKTYNPRRRLMRKTVRQECPATILVRVVRALNKLKVIELSSKHNHSLENDSVCTDMPDDVISELVNTGPTHNGLLSNRLQATTSERQTTEGQNVMRCNETASIYDHSSDDDEDESNSSVHSDLSSDALDEQMTFRINNGLLGVRQQAVISNTHEDGQNVKSREKTTSEQDQSQNMEESLSEEEKYSLSIDLLHDVARLMSEKGTQEFEGLYCELVHMRNLLLMSKTVRVIQLEGSDACRLMTNSEETTPQDRDASSKRKILRLRYRNI